MKDENKIISLMMKRQFLSYPANEKEYDLLYRDVSPGQNVYWNGFGDPPSLTFRASFNDIEYNRNRQFERILIKGRFGGGNIGWIEQNELELFSGLYKKPIEKPDKNQLLLLDLIENEGPMTIAVMKEMTGMLVRDITPVLHRLQEAFLIYEDQYDGGWDRGWYMFSEMFSDVDLNKYSRIESLKTVLVRYAERFVYFNSKMAKSFYRLPERDINAAIKALLADEIIIEYSEGYILKKSEKILNEDAGIIKKKVYVMHRNDVLVKSNEYWLKEKYNRNGLDILQYILLDGKFCGAVLGHFKNGPYVIEDISLSLPYDEIIARKEEIIEAVYCVNDRNRSKIKLYNGMEY